MSYPVDTALTYTAVAATSGAPSDTFTYAWAFDDATNAIGATYAKTWASVGSHLATVTATDTVTGGTATADKIVTIVPSVYTVSTLAGLYGTDGRVDATGGSARFSEVYHLSVDTSNGDIYTGSLDLGAYPYDGHCVRKITQGGVVTTVMVGQGAPGSQSGIPVDGTTPGTATSGWPYAASYNNTSGDLYISDGNGLSTAIRRVTGGNSYLFAGLYILSGSIDATGGSARLNGTRNIAFNASGTIGYFVDADSHTVRSITTPGAVVTTIAGLARSLGSADGTGSTARFNLPRGVCMGNDGNIYIADTENSTIRCCTPAGVVTTVAGLAGNVGGTDGVGSAARFNRPYGITAALTNVFYVTDTGNNIIRKMVVSGGTGTTTTVIGSGINSGTDGIGTAASVTPLGICWYNGMIFLGNDTSIRKVVIT